MDLNTWINTNHGRGDAANPLDPNPPHSIPGQCVTAASSWSMAQGGPELLGATAWDIWGSFDSPFFELVMANSGHLPEPGDIVFFYPNNSAVGTGPAGHVDVCAAEITDQGFIGVDMDWNGNSLLQYVSHSFNGVAGWFHAKEDQVTQEQYQELMAALVDIKNWELNIYKAIAGAVGPDALPSNLLAIVEDIKQWELNIDNDVKGKNA